MQSPILQIAVSALKTGRGRGDHLLGVRQTLHYSIFQILLFQTVFGMVRDIITETINTRVPKFLKQYNVLDFQFKTNFRVQLQLTFTSIYFI